MTTRNHETMVLIRLTVWLYPALLGEMGQPGERGETESGAERGEMEGIHRME